MGSAITRLAKKEYVVCVYEDHVTYEIRLQGGGAPERIDYFRGAKTGGATHYFVADCLYCQAEDMDYEQEKRFVELRLVQTVASLRPDFRFITENCGIQQLEFAEAMKFPGSAAPQCRYLPKLHSAT